MSNNKTGNLHNMGKLYQRQYPGCDIVLHTVLHGGGANCTRDLSVLFLT